MQESAQQQRAMHRRSLQFEDAGSLRKNIGCNRPASLIELHEMPLENKRRAPDNAQPYVNQSAVELPIFPTVEIIETESRIRRMISEPKQENDERPSSSSSHFQDSVFRSANGLMEDFFFMELGDPQFMDWAAEMELISLLSRSKEHGINAACGNERKVEHFEF